MLFDLNLLLTIPQAIHSIRELLKGGFTEKLPPSNDDIQLVTNRLEGLTETLKLFAASFQELDAWKEIHDITNRLREHLNAIYIEGIKTDNINTFRADFNYEATSTVVLREIRQMRKAGFCIAQIENYPESYHNLIGDLSYTNKERKAWNIIITHSIEDLKYNTEEGVPNNIYRGMELLTNYINRLNHLADLKLKEIISEYTKKMTQLESLI